MVSGSPTKYQRARRELQNWTSEQQTEASSHFWLPFDLQHQAEQQSRTDAAPHNQIYFSEMGGKKRTKKAQKTAARLLHFQEPSKNIFIPSVK